jgi:hypothetical protein
MPADAAADAAADPKSQPLAKSFETICGAAFGAPAIYFHSLTMFTR